MPRGVAFSQVSWDEKQMSTSNTSSQTTKSQDLRTTMLNDLCASVVVFLVALPLCIGIAVAVGVSPARALITGIIGGVIVGMFAGSPLQVSGPAAGLFVIVADMLAKGREKYLAGVSEEVTEAAAEAAAEQYSLVVLGVSVFLAGALQLVAGRLRLGQWFRAVSPAVIKGMLAGIGVLILVSQFHVMLDHVAMWHGEKAHGGLQYLATIPEAIMKCFSTDTTANHHHAAMTGIVAIACFLIWPRIAPAKVRFLPAALIGVVVATLYAMVTRSEVQLLEVPKNMLTEVTLPSSAWLTILLDQSVMIGGAVIALVASAETLLCATAVDQMHSGPRTKYDQELSAQGVGNMLCGLCGALPMTGVIVRSSANVNAGGKTKLSTILHGIWLLIFVVAIPSVLTYIPRSALGALLVYTGIKLVNVKAIRDLWKAGRGEAVIYFVTLGMIVCTDLLIGVAVGVALSAMKLLARFSNLQVELEVSADQKEARLIMHGAATFLNLPKLAGKLEQVPDNAQLHVEFDRLSYIDHACLDLIMNWAKQHGGHLVLDWEKLHGRFASEDPQRGGLEFSGDSTATRDESKPT